MLALRARVTIGRRAMPTLQLASDDDWALDSLVQGPPPRTAGRDEVAMADDEGDAGEDEGGAT
jgi:hypothetical protein